MLGDSSYLNYAAFARREGRSVDLSSVTPDIEQFHNMLDDFGKEAFMETRKIVDFYESDEYHDLIDTVFEDIEDVYDDIYHLDLFIPENLEEFFDATDDMKYGLMYLDEMYQSKEDQLIAGFDYDYGAVEDIKDTVEYKELHAGRTTPDRDGGFYASPTGGVSIEDYLMIQDIYTAYCKKLVDEDVTEIKQQ